MFKKLLSLLTGGAKPDAVEVVRNVAAGRAVLIDVRETSELQQSGIAAGALHLPLSRLPQLLQGNATALPAEIREAPRPIYVYCASGMRSRRAAGLLRAAGVAQVENLGSLRDWNAGGGKTVAFTQNNMS